MLERFARFRAVRYSHQSGLFDPKREHVFKSEYAHYNLFDPELDHWLPHSRRHRWFASMGSSQSLAVSVFGTMLQQGDLALLSSVPDEHGRPLLPGFELASSAKPEFDHRVTTLHEPRPTQVDLFLPGQHGNVAIECKLWEREVGDCSHVPAQCDGRYAPHIGRPENEHCILTGKGIAYWRYIPQLFLWSDSESYPTCPMWKSYQLVRNVLAAAVDPATGKILGRPVAILVYDANNPESWPGGRIDEQFCAIQASLREPTALRRTTWQAIAGVLAERGGYGELVAWLEEKYGILG